MPMSKEEMFPDEERYIPKKWADHELFDVEAMRLGMGIRPRPVITDERLREVAEEVFAAYGGLFLNNPTKEQMEQAAIAILRKLIEESR